jgi:D-serine deaminase-like pyridoxal phosphate-dependent protein
VWHTPVGAVTEQRPGTYVFNDRQQVALGAAGLEDVAFMVAATVTSTAVPGQVVVNAGAKALSKERPELLAGHGTVLGYPDSQITQVTDFHGVIETPPGLPRPGLGDAVAIVPNHVCAAVNLARELLVVDHGQVTATWAIDGRG